jgi:AraC family transcriptional regulator of adaptative response / DNA-3-methyladenine glycosylase II
MSMRWSDDFLYAHSGTRDGSYDGCFIIAVTTTGIYCLPSCPARKPKRENVRFFRHEHEAIEAGFRACLRCRPDMFYRGDDIDRDRYGAVVNAVTKSDDHGMTAASLARTIAVSATKLNELVRVHGHTTPASLIRKAKIQQAMQQLIGTNDRITDIAYATGFESESTFHRQFVQQTALSPGAYRALRESTYFVLRLPASYRVADPLGYHGRDPSSRSEAVQGNAIHKPMVLDGVPLVLTTSLTEDGAACDVSSGKLLEPATMATIHAICLRMLGLTADPTPFESHVSKTKELAKVVAQRPGLRIPLTATNWEALAWAIIGQQINLAFACSLRRELVELVGTSVEGGMIAHPDASTVAKLDERDLTKRRYSSSKARYLIGAARAVASKTLDIDALSMGSAQLAAVKLEAVAGIGTWTANYVMMRGLGFVDCVPVGDSALSMALQRAHELGARPDATATTRLMEAYAPYRSFATAHLWASVSDR